MPSHVGRCHVAANDCTGLPGPPGARNVADKKKAPEGALSLDLGGILTTWRPSFWRVPGAFWSRLAPRVSSVREQRSASARCRLRLPFPRVA